MKKIKTLITLYPSFERGGATKNLINFINTCDKKNIQILLISNIDKNLKKKLLNKNIKVINFFDKLKNRNFQRFFTSFFSIFALLKIFKKIDFESSLVISFQSHILPIIICRLFGRKIIIRNSEDIIDATKYADNKFSAYFIFILKMLFYNFSSGIITNSIKSKKSLDQIIFNNKCTLIYNPYLKKIFKKKKKLRQNYILSVGRLCKQKNQIITIKAFAIFLEKFPNYKLILIGHGHDESKLKNLCQNLNISKNVIFKGWINNPNKYYSEAKVLIFPSLYEGLPNTLIDAINYDLPCISSKCSGAIDILTEKHGIFIHKDNYKMLSKKIEFVINNYRKVFSRTNNIKKKLSRFLIKPQVSEYLNYCKNQIE